MQREKLPEPSTVMEILQGAHWQVRCLLREMQQILQTPTAIYELYPRIRTSFAIHDEAEHAVLYPACRELSNELADRGESEHREINGIFERLDRLPWRRQQIQSSSWKLDFLSLHDAIARHFEWEQYHLFPRLSDRLRPARVAELTEAYRRVLTKDIDAYRKEAR